MLPRTTLARSNAFVVRRIVPRRPAQGPARFQSTSSSSSSSPFVGKSNFDASHVAAGVAGGLTVVLVGYAWYHTSGLRGVVKSAKEMKSYLKSTTERAFSKANDSAEHPNNALYNMRQIAKSYTFPVPGSKAYVDDVFDELEWIYDTHVDEMDLILKETTEELLKATRNRRPRESETETARNVSSILGNGIRRMKDLGKKAGGDILDRHPAVKEKLGNSYEQLGNLAQKAGPEGKIALKEARERVRELVRNGTPDEGSIKRVQEYIQAQTSRLKRNVGESEVVNELLRNVPDTEELLKKAPHVGEIVNLARERSEEAKNLVKETVSDVVSVLEEKGKKAKELSERNKN